MSKYNYHICKSSWSINIQIVAEKKHITNISKEIVCKICDRLWFCFNEIPIDGSGEMFCAEEKEFIIKGLKMIGSQIVQKNPCEDTLIKVTSLTYDLCDYQPEGLSMAIILWAQQEFELELPEMDVLFDKKINKYIFDFDSFVSGLR